MLRSPKFLIVALVLIGVVFVGFTVIRLGWLLTPNPVAPRATSTPGGGGTGPEGSIAPPNAFVPQPSIGNQPPTGEQIQGPSPVPWQIPTPKVSIPEIQKRLEAALPPLPPKNEMLALPAISDAEIKIDPAGLKTTEEYLTYFAQHAKDVPFDKSRFKDVLKDSNKINILPAQLIEKVLAGDTSPALQTSIKTFKDAIDSEISYFEKLGVFGEAATYNKKMIGFQKLQAQLLERGLAVLSGSLAKETLRDFSLKLKNTASEESQVLMQRMGLLSAKKQQGFFEKIATDVMEFLGLREKAYGQLSTGGRFTVLEPCTCSSGDYLIFFTGIPAVLYINQFWSIANFALFYLVPPVPGLEFLALYTPVTIPCLQVPYCEPSGVGFTPMIMGTGP